MQDPTAKLATKRNITLCCSGCLLIFGIASLAIAPTYDPPMMGWGMAILFLGFGGAILLTALLTYRRKIAALETTGMVPLSKGLSANEQKVLGILRVYPKISLKDLGEKLNMDDNKAEGVLIAMVTRGLIYGHIDPGTKEFISAMNPTMASVTAPVSGAVLCPNCGAPLPSVPIRGTTMKCPACGNLIMS
nr:PCI domain-containing protein [Candidatus Sigynarchaeota archaeon]